MFKKMMNFQRLFYFPNNSNSNKPGKKLFLIGFLVSFSIIVGDKVIGDKNPNAVSMFLIIIFIINTMINRSVKLWDLVPISNKFAICNIFFSFYYLICLMILVNIIFAIILFGSIYLFSGGNSSLLLNDWNSFLSDVRGFNIFGGIVGTLFFFIMGNICITMCFIKDTKYRLGSLITILGLFFTSAYVFKLTYNIRLFDALANIENINFKYILLGTSLILFIISLFGGIKIALNLHRKIVINE